MKKHDGRLIDFIFLLFLLLVTIALYYPTLNFQLTNYDDPLHISLQKEVTSGISLQNILWAFSATPSNLWHPLTWISYMLESTLSPSSLTDKTIHHWGNVALYLLTLVFIYLGLRKTDVFSPLTCQLSLLIFALHPLHVEPVAWVSSRKDVLSGLFIVLSLFCYVVSKERKKPVFFLLTSIFFYICALLSKPSAVILPFLLIIIDLLLLKKNSLPIQWKTLWHLTLQKCSYFLIAIPLSLFTVLIQNNGTSTYFIAQSKLWERLIEIPAKCGFYFHKIFFPLQLTFEYPSPIGLQYLLYSLLGMALLCLPIYKAYRDFRKKTVHLFTLGTLWVFICLAPTLGFFFVSNNSFIADRYTYLAILPPILGFVCLLHYLTNKKITTALTLCLLFALYPLSKKQIMTWKNDYALFQHALNIYPNHITALGNLGARYRLDGKEALALECYEKAIRLNPHDYISLHNKSQILYRKNKKRQAIETCQKSIAAHPEYAPSHYLMGYLLLKSDKNSTTLQKAKWHYEKALALKPKNAKYRRALLRLK